MADWMRRLRSTLLAVTFVSIFLYIFFLNFRPPDHMDVLQRAVVETVSPVVESLNGVSTLIEDAVHDYVLLRQVRRENEDLRHRVVELEQQVMDYHEAAVENQRLRRLLDFKSGLRGDTVPARVVMHDLTGWFQTMLVDKGFKDKIGPDMAVVNDEGVVGRTLDVSDHNSRVLLITDPGSAVDVVIQRNRVRGILAGKDNGNCILKYVRGNIDVQVGDLVMSSGKDGIFPKGLRLGTIQGITKDPVDMFQKIDVKPLVRLNALEEIMIIRRIDASPDDPSDNLPGNAPNNPAKEH